MPLLLDQSQASVPGVEELGFRQAAQVRGKEVPLGLGISDPANRTTGTAEDAAHGSVMKFGKKFLFMCAIVAGYVIFMFALFYAMFRVAVHYQAFYSPIETQYQVEGQNSVKIVPKEEK